MGQQGRRIAGTANVFLSHLAARKSKLRNTQICEEANEDVPRS